MPEADIIVVGAGSAGCALASRLSEDPKISVLLIEAGGRDWSPMLHIPLASGKLLRTGAFGWKYETAANEGLNGRHLLWPRGRVLGGCSAINGMVYIRGSRGDYDRLAGAGLDGWSFDEVMPYFLRSEGHRDRGEPYHNRGGVLKVSKAQAENPLYRAFVEAGINAGYPRSDDFNGECQDGFGYFDFNIAKGRRCSSATAFLKNERSRPNLNLLLNRLVRRVVLDGKRAVAVETQSGGETEIIRARKEVIICGGTVNSPHLLMLSGIGDPDMLRAVGLPVVHALQGVGMNLQDHIDMPVRFGIDAPVSMHSLIRFDRIAMAMAQALVMRTGPAASFPTEAGAFLRTEAGLHEPDMQIHFSIALGGDRIRFPLFTRSPGIFERDGFQMRMCVLRPRSRGQIRLKSSDPTDKAIIEPNYLSDPLDVKLLMKGVEIARKIASQPPLKDLIVEELTPGPDVRNHDLTALEAVIRAEAASVYHPVGTCKMGLSGDPQSVVDSRLRVHGIEGLRVADASIFPNQIGGNTHAPAVMVGEKAADMVLDRPPLQTGWAGRALGS